MALWLLSRTTRMFGGKTYTLRIVANNKREAVRQAKYWRQQGKFVRVIPEGKKPNRWGLFVMGPGK